MAIKDKDHSYESTNLHSCGEDSTRNSSRNRLMRRFQEWRMRQKKAQTMRMLAKKLVMVDEVMLIHTDEVI